jgi:hypothetical protein
MSDNNKDWGGLGQVKQSGLFGGSAWSLTANVNEATAITDAKEVDGQWPRWQISYFFTGGTTKTATLKPMYQDIEEDGWHKLGAYALKDSFTSDSGESQLSDIIAPAGAKKVAMVLEDSVGIGTITIKVKGVA